MYLLSFYVTEDYLKEVKQALFAAGAGAYGCFKNCAWETLGQGQYQINEEHSNLVSQPEYKVEILCQENYILAAIQALKQVHPCDEPAFYLTQIKVEAVESGESL